MGELYPACCSHRQRALRSMRYRQLCAQQSVRVHPSEGHPLKLHWGNCVVTGRGVTRPTYKVVQMAEAA